jgi:prevent-host-death family protein
VGRLPHDRPLGDLISQRLTPRLLVSEREVVIVILSNAMPSMPRCDNRSTSATLPSMTEVASRELRNNTRQLLERVEAGEEITITVGGRPKAMLVPMGRKPRWMGREEFMAMLEGRRADPGLRDDLRRLIPDTTDDIPPR